MGDLVWPDNQNFTKRAAQILAWSDDRHSAYVNTNTFKIYAGKRLTLF